MDKAKIEKARLISCRVKRLKEALMEIRELRYVKLHGDEECGLLLRKIQEKIEFNILKYEKRISDSISALTNYSQASDIEISYISKIDIDRGFVDISKLQDGSRILNLTTGEISTEKLKICIN